MKRTLLLSAILTGALANAQGVLVSALPPTTARALDIQRVFLSTAPVTVFATHFDSGYVTSPHIVQPNIETLLQYYKSRGGDTIYVSKNNFMCAVIKPKISNYDFPTMELRYGKNWLSGRTCDFEISPQTYPKDLNPTAIVFESIGGEHGVISAQQAVIAGGYFGGCAGLTASQVLVNWIHAGKSDGHIWFAPKALYNDGCYDYARNRSVEEHKLKRLSGEMTTLEQCFPKLNLKTNWDFASYLRGYLNLWLIPNMTDSRSNLYMRWVPKVSGRDYTFKFYRGSVPIGSSGRGSKVFHLHLGQPSLD